MTSNNMKSLLSLLTLSLMFLLTANTAIAMPENTSVKTNTQPTAIMVLGDSISAAYGIAQDHGWVNLLQQHLNQRYSDKKYEVINASISGETTGGALKRLPELLNKHQPAIIIIELGGNDGLRGFPINRFRSNLEQLVTLSQSAKATVLITGMHIPPNYGPRYTHLFYDSYAITAQKFKVGLVPFLLENIATHPELMQKDGIHPVAKAQPRILQNVLNHLKDILDQAG